MTGPELELPAEARLLVALARLRPDTDVRGRVHDLLTRHEEFDWGRFVDLASRHMVLPLISRNVLRNRLSHDDDGRQQMPYAWLYADVYQGTRRRNLALSDEFGRVLGQLNAAGLRYVIRKGPALTDGLYRDPGTRRMSDLDVLIRRTDLPVLAEVATTAGYDVGKVTPTGTRIAPFDRRTTLYWQVNLGNVALPYLKLGHRPEVETFILSPCFSLFQPNAGLPLSPDPFLERATPTVIYGQPARVLDPADQLIDACVQLHAEATLLYYIESDKDLTLRKFVDLVELLHVSTAQDLSRFRTRAHELGCGPSVHYALHYTRQLYPEAVPPGLAEEFQPADTAYLDEYGGFDGTPKRWDVGFTERLFDRGRRHAVEVRSNVPGTRSSV
ncbi:nucleotidyltransferase domain-containing protein [Micromonospora sp. DT62]|uniref:nucleotidyltransferase domain-containing protein n=1 Tax=Micromonospora sp. DT62 TaxID=3416521 RepID=UPI003CF2241C